jgi:hypothetical protein
MQSTVLGRLNRTHHLISGWESWVASTSHLEGSVKIVMKSGRESSVRMYEGLQDYSVALLPQDTPLHDRTKCRD